jgi:putative ABC transport system permease protein
MSRRLLDAFIRALPWSFRDEFGPEMKGVFEEEVAVARARGGRAAVAWLWLRTTRDLLVLAARQHGSDLARDLRHGWRGLRANPAFTAGAMLTLTLGMAPATVVFSVLDAVVLEPLPYPDSERLVAVWGTNPGRTAREMPLSMPNVADVMATQTSLEALGAHAASSFTLTGEGEPERVRGALVTPGVLRALGVQPVAGRLFADDEDDPGTEPVAILSHGLWQRRFGGRADVIGRSMPIDGRPVPIVGVMPDEFNFPSRAALWMPLVFDLQSMPRGSNFASAVGRLKFGLSLAQAEAELHGIAASIARDNMDTAANFRLYLTPLQDDVIGDAPRVLSTVAAGLAFVLLVACANVAGLLIVRTSGRERELAIRLTSLKACCLSGSEAPARSCWAGGCSR